MKDRSSLHELVRRASNCLARAKGRDVPVVESSCPILFFGDLTAYCLSPRRVVTVGVNPSWHEFPEGAEFQRFPRYLEDQRLHDTDPDEYLDTLSDYFRVKPHCDWFRHLEVLLNGVDASYHTDEESTVKWSTALHTDLLSPLATKPTWSGLKEKSREELREDGVDIWHDLLSVLEPDLVLACVGTAHLRHIRFSATDDWSLVAVFDETVKRKRRTPYMVVSRRYAVGTARPLFVFCPPGRRYPVPIGKDQKRELGRRVKMAL